MDIIKYSGRTDFVWAVELNRFGLRLVGLWPRIDEDESNRVVSDFRLGIAFVIVAFLSGIPFVCALIRVWGDLTLMIDNLGLTLTFLAILLELVIMRWKQSAMSSMLKMMLEDWLKLKVDKERKVMIRRARTARLIIICGYCLMASGFIIIIIFSSLGLPYRRLTNLTDRNRALPIQAYYFYDTDKSPQFEITFLVQALSIFLGTIVYSSVNSFLGLSILHMCGQLEIFRHRLIDWTLCTNFEDTLRKNIKMHQRLIRFAENIEDIFSVLLLGLVIYFSIVFCLFTVVLLAIFTGNNADNMSFSNKCFALVAGFTLFAHTFLYCGAGEMIMEQNEGVYLAIYDSEWYKLDSRRIRSLMFLMMRTRMSFRITAGKVIPLTMATFCSLLKTSAGYTSFLLAMRDET